MGEAGQELLLASQKLSPHELQTAGFSFLDESVESAISHIA
jgi:NAD dependent epimerase/dehydratase family enzyme